MLCLKGLIVVDAFQAWCGPCKTVVDLFRKIRNEVGSDLLHFAVAEVDSIDALEEYRGKCEPVFLFYTVSGNTFKTVKVAPKLPFSSGERSPVWGEGLTPKAPARRTGLQCLQPAAGRASRRELEADMGSLLFTQQTHCHMQRAALAILRVPPENLVTDSCFITFREEN
uniref:Thioredoxin domain-containing protein n=1 Tax=Apteryx owenii TaxID=8824 RepID=A0A8B9NRX1_APTOW